MRLAQRAHGGYKRANILIIFRTANSEPCFLGLLSVTPENGACQHPVPLPTCFRTDSPRPSSPGPSQQGPQSLPVPRLPSRSDPLRPGPFFPGRLFPGRLLPGRFALRSSDDFFPALGRVLPETTRSRPKLSDKPPYGGSRAPARPRRRRSSQLLGDYFRPPLVAPRPVSIPRSGFKTSYLGLFRHLGRAGNP